MAQPIPVPGQNRIFNLFRLTLLASVGDNPRDRALDLRWQITQWFEIKQKNKFTYEDLSQYIREQLQASNTTFSQAMGITHKLCENFEVTFSIGQ